MAFFAWKKKEMSRFAAASSSSLCAATSSPCCALALALRSLPFVHPYRNVTRRERWLMIRVFFFMVNRDDLPNKRQKTQ